MIGIFGGSFNPIHLGHTNLSEWLVCNGYADKVWLMVSPQNPLKQQRHLLDENLRLHLAKIAVENLSGVEVSDFEIRLPKPTYTYKTLSSLSATYPDEEFALIIGSDNWQIFHKWAQWEYILQHYRIIVYPRKGYEIDAHTLPENVQLVSAPLFPYSSTEVRKAIAERDHICTSMLHPAVLSEIHRLGLYQTIGIR